MQTYILIIYHSNCHYCKQCFKNQKPVNPTCTCRISVFTLWPKVVTKDTLLIVRFNYDLLREKSSCTVFCKFNSGRNTFLPLIVLLVTIIRTQCMYVNCNHKCFLMKLLHDNFFISFPNIQYI